MLSPFSAPASLPDADAKDPRREEAIRDAREEYVWDWSWPPGCATLRRLPRADQYPIGFIAKTAALQARVIANRAALAIDGVDFAATARALPTGDLTESLREVADSVQLGAPRSHPRAVEDYARYFEKLPVPPLVDLLRARPQDADLLFAWQRVGGANPMSLHRITRLPDDLAVSEAQWDAVMGGGSLARALDDGRVFAVDYSFLHGVTTNRYLDRQKYLCGARGVFATDRGPLRPLAIQLEPGGRVFTPRDGAAWEMARYCLNVADANVHETMEHLGATHLVMEAVGVAARRQLAEAHPLRRLLEPHIEGTFAINESAKTSLIAPEGVIDRVFAARIDLAAGLVRVALDRFSLQDRAPALELRARGVDDPETLPEFPYRDDVTRVYAAIERFVGEYVRIYYPDDAAVSADPELRAWVAESGSPIGGALRGVRPVETLDALVTWMTNIVHVASAQHAAVNFPQYPYFGWGANTAGACWAPPPRPDATREDLLALMPAWDCLMQQTDTVFQLSGVYYNRLGDYALRDPRADEAVARFAAELAALDRNIAEADALRRAPYPFLRPSLIPSSINI